MFTHEGFMLVILSPELDLTNSLLIKRPVGRVIFLPLGAVRSTLRSDILERLEKKRMSVCVGERVRFDLKARVNGLVKNLNMYNQLSLKKRRSTNQSGAASRILQGLCFLIESCKLAYDGDERCGGLDSVSNSTTR